MKTLTRSARDGEAPAASTGSPPPSDTAPDHVNPAATTADLPRCVRELETGTPLGTLYIVAEGEALTRILFRPPLAPASGPSRPSARTGAITRAAASQLREYLAGERRRFDLPLAPHGTPFQLQVWRALYAIPWGETISYGELARRIGKPRAVRAVGAANGANPLSIVVPCHRVVGSDGRLTGYGGGLAAKGFLLELEGWSPA